MEVCNGIDDDCDGLTDPDNTSDCKVFYRDNDGDGYGDSSHSICACKSRSNYTSSKGGDCCDDDFRVFPGQQEFFSDASFCGGHDFNCDGVEDKQDTSRYAGCDSWPSCGARIGWPLSFSVLRSSSNLCYWRVRLGSCLGATRPTRSKGGRLVGEVVGQVRGQGQGRDRDGRGQGRGQAGSRNWPLALFICCANPLNSMSVVCLGFRELPCAGFALILLVAGCGSSPSDPLSDGSDDPNRPSADSSEISEGIPRMYRMKDPIHQIQMRPRKCGLLERWF